MFKRNQKSISENTNILCLVFGHIQYFNSYFYHPLQVLFRPLLNLYHLFFNNIGEFAPELAYDIFLRYSYPFEDILHLIPFGFGYEFTCGYKHVDLSDYVSYSPCGVDFSTVGLTGLKYFKDEMYGQLPRSPAIHSKYTYPATYVGLTYNYPAIFGFTGIKYPVSPANKWNYYLLMGSALWVKLGEEPPV
jgi:hypothetical protein